jgi:hypothetical protein
MVIDTIHGVNLRYDAQQVGSEMKQGGSQMFSLPLDIQYTMLRVSVEHRLMTPQAEKRRLLVVERLGSLHALLSTLHESLAATIGCSRL